MATKNVNKEMQKDVIETKTVSVSEKPKKKRKLSANTEKLNSITFEYMVEYIEKNAPNDKEWFIENAFVEEKYKHFQARKAFVERYMPELCKANKGKWAILVARKWVA